MSADALDTEYENGIADVLAFLAKDAAVVERNVQMPGAKSDTDRQIDVKVTGRIFGAGNATMVVDCKRYKKSLDVIAVGAFVGLVEDVGADFGLLVTTTGVSEAAKNYAKSVRGIRLDILPIETLAAWSPKGTVNFDYAVPESLHSEAVRSVRRAGFRVRPVDVPEWRGLDGHLGLSAFRHFGTANPSGEIQSEARKSLLIALKRVNVTEPVGMSNGVVFNGGTPGHRHLEVSFGGQEIGVKVLVASEQDITSHLDAISDSLGLPRELLDVIRPDVWPIPIMFPAWG